MVITAPYSLEMPLTITPLPNLPLIQPGDDLAGLILSSLKQAEITLQNGDILVLAQKVVSKAENRLVNLADVTPSPPALEVAQKTGKDPRLAELLLRESSEILRMRTGTAIVEHRLGFVCANAGIDQSNVAPPPSATRMDENNPAEWVLLLPENPDQSAAEIRTRLESASGKRLGVLIIDSHGRAWRLGTVGVAIGLSGLPGLIDERGWRDLFGYALKITVVGVADELAAAASLVMGQAAEGRPIVHVRGFPYPLREGSFKELLRPKEQDMFR
ncbi:MAG: coenzyme F420-0:L-glutamate ligase [Anaerolineales bacterium]